ncbi:MAG: protein-L-isoaspartate(D-aspartate) O-methyltransferase [Chloroflexi bacterium]|nr:MAG: protein-L-isoaspartate(D-aspartate) O-methyltransferase [Chloroflexota bacterium]MBL1194508.1 protein-L-isoaspartate(D-aspartate) O-methyltransferase [Chloroflexota bacterium]NOH11796.1 protein-L-isoaspartate(D-aspartate) O-methyltransferase [Chloroflexota bacterium]
MKEAPKYLKRRKRMVAEQLEGRRIVNQRVLDAFLAVPRQLFVNSEDQSKAYHDQPLRIAAGQTISQPYIVALMTQLLNLQGEEKVLEVGTGSGYQTALLAHLAGEVHSIELHLELVKQAKATLSSLGLENVRVYEGDGSHGLPDEAPFDAILAAAAAPRVPQPLLDQLTNGGRLILPVGDAQQQVLQRWVRYGDKFNFEDVVPVAFVPLRGEQGWSKEGWEDSRDT